MGEWLNELQYVHTVEYYSIVEEMNDCYMHQLGRTSRELHRMNKNKSQKRHLYNIFKKL